MTAEKMRFLQEMGQVVTRNFSGYSVGANGVVEGGFGKWEPVEDPTPMDELLLAMRLSGLDPGAFKFQQYEVTAANPLHGGKVDLKFGRQMAVKGPRYAGLHNVVLVARSPFVAAVEIANSLEPVE